MNQIIPLITILDLAKGRKMIIETDMKISAELEIKEIKENFHSKDVQVSNAKNDWWPAQQTWTTYTVFFTNGASKEYHSLDKIQLF